MTLLPARGVVLHPAGICKIARLSAAALALFSSFALACVRGDRSQGPDASSPPSGQPVQAMPATPPTPTGASTDPGTPPSPSPAPQAERGTSTVCNTDSDCRTFSDGCGICSCRPFAKTSPDPKCPGPRMKCLIDPCTGLRTICRKGNCMIGDPGDAAPPNATDAATKGTSPAEAAGQRTDGTPSIATSATPKVADAAPRD